MVNLVPGQYKQQSAVVCEMAVIPHLSLYLFGVGFLYLPSVCAWTT